MSYTVVWRPSAERNLADLWTEAGDRAAVARAADTIDRELKRDPGSKGEGRSGVGRLFIVPPLAVEFDVSEADKLVTVQRDPVERARIARDGCVKPDVPGDAMTIELNEQQWEAVLRAEVVRVSAPELRKEVVLLHAQVYDELQKRLEDEREQAAFRAFARKQAAKLVRENHHADTVVRCPNGQHA